MTKIFRILAAFFSLFFASGVTLASTGDAGARLDLTMTGYGIIALVLFIIAYSLVIAEEFLHLRKSKPVIVVAGVIWILVAIAYATHGDTSSVTPQLKHTLLEFAELMLFLLAAMTYINTMEERNLFKALRSWLVSRGFSLRTIFWLTGLLAFFISPLADNLTTALLMGAVVMSVGAGHTKFIVIGCINVVVAANAGGAFSPFGDITTLMVWQKGIVQFQEFFAIFFPSLVNWLVPAIIMTMVIPKAKPNAPEEHIEVKQGGYVVIALFMFTISMAVMGHNYLHLPPFLGMMTGLGLLKLYGYRLKQMEKLTFNEDVTPAHLDIEGKPEFQQHYKLKNKPFDIFISLKRAEWDTLLFFYGVIMAVGGLGMIGYLALVSEAMYVGLGPTWANVLVGILSAIVDNIPVMFAVLTMYPEMNLNQWLLVTLTAGVGGSMLSIGSAAGVALMGQARGIYTFFAHLKWTWAIALGYVASIWLHLLINPV